MQLEKYKKEILLAIFVSRLYIGSKYLCSMPMNTSTFCLHVFAMILYYRLLYAFIDAWMDNWIKKNFKKTRRPQTLILIGDSGTGDESRCVTHLPVTLSESLAFLPIGKTTFALSLFVSLNVSPPHNDS